MLHQRINVIFSVLLAALLCAAGCTDDLRSRNMFDTGIGEAVISFSVEKPLLSRSEDGGDMESVIDHAYLLFYSSDDDMEHSVPLAAVKAEAVDAVAGTLTFKMPLRLEPDTDYRLLAVANADEYVPDGFGSFEAYLQTWCLNSDESKGSLQLYSPERMLAGKVASLPMRGGVSGRSPFRYSMSGDGYDVSATLTFRRLAARIDVANIVKEGFTVDGVALCNWRDAVSLTSDVSALGNRNGNVCGILTVDGEETGDDIFVNMTAPGDGGIQQLQKEIYCLPSISYESHASDKESTALIIKARYGTDTEPSYYRVNVNAVGNRSELKPNTKYTVTIQSVKGRGASSAKEAYAAEESPLVLSVVEDWDLEGSFAMDADGNFIVLSTGRVEFEGDAVSSYEVRVITSKGLLWTTESLPSENSIDAFSITKLSSSIVIATNEVNVKDTDITGICRVTALTPAGERLTVDITLVQKTAGELPEGPIIPWDKPFALVPMEPDRVKIDHDARTIEIDGFDPDCFNSFIDIPFQTYINSSFGEDASLTVSSSLEWPLEGQISDEKASGYYYCMKSFSTGVVCSSLGNEVASSAIHRDQVSAANRETLYISIGAMAPDDPQIMRNVKLTVNSESNSESIVYTVAIKPRPVIMDDVVLTDETGQSWLIMDRNVQDVNNTEASTKCVGRDHSKNGRKHQAYHFCKLEKFNLVIPFKYKDQDNTPFSEDTHAIYKGCDIDFYLLSNTANKNKRVNWLAKYKYTDTDEKTSPYYDDSSINSWLFPDRTLIGLCVKKMKVSKMRMFLMSDVPVHDGNAELPICCYWPCYYKEYPTLSTTWFKHGYLISSTASLSENAGKMVYIYCDSSEVQIYDWTSDGDDIGHSRLVRSLTPEELEKYKNDYLGYGSTPHRQIVCHPDTHASPGWLSY